MLAAAALILKAIYFALPPASLLVFYRKSGGPMLRRSLAGAWVTGTILGACMAAGYSLAMGGWVSPGQVALACYMAVALLLLLRVFDQAILRLTRLALGVKPSANGGWRLWTALALRVVFSATITLPWVMAAVMVYRPRVTVAENPGDLLQTTCDDVRFDTADRTRIAGWYVPSAGKSDTTALLCHGLGSGRAGWLTLIERLHRGGVNVLAIDLRAHGNSGGQLCTFGDKETLDALAAVDWLKSTHADGSARIIGVGASMGSAALLQAAARDDRLDGVVSLSTFDTLPNEVADVARLRLPPPFAWLMRNMGLPIASLHTGVDLRTVRPIDAIEKIWPRPVLIIHATGDEIIPFAQGLRLFRSATLPKQSLWIEQGSHNGLLQDPAVLKAVEAFIKGAKTSSVI